MGRKLHKWAFCLAALSLFLLTACGSGDQTGTGGGSTGGTQGGDSGKGGEGTIKIGMIADLSGKSALSGKYKMNGATLALEEINANGGTLGKKMELVVEDHQGTQQGAVAAFQKLASDKEIVAIIGSIRSTNMKALDSYVKKAGIPVAMGGTNIDLTKQLQNPWYFRFRPHDGYAAKTIAEFTANKVGAKKVAIIHDTDAFGTGGKDLLVEEYKNLGVEVVDIEGYNTGTKDFSPFLQKMADAGAEAVNTYMTNSEDAGLMVNQIREKGYQFQLVGSPSLAQQVTLDIAKENLNGVYSVNDFALDQSPETIQFVEKYKAKYNTNPDVYAGWVYDALHIFDMVIEQKQSTDPNDIREGMLAIKDYRGAEGHYSFDEFGDGLHSYSIVTVQDGKIVTVKD